MSEQDTPKDDAVKPDTGAAQGGADADGSGNILAGVQPTKKDVPDSGTERRDD